MPHHFHIPSPTTSTFKIKLLTLNSTLLHDCKSNFILRMLENNKHKVMVTGQGVSCPVKWRSVKQCWRKLTTLHFSIQAQKKEVPFQTWFYLDFFVF